MTATFDVIFVKEIEPTLRVHLDDSGAPKCWILSLDCTCEDGSRARISIYAHDHETFDCLTAGVPVKEVMP